MNDYETKELDVIAKKINAHKSIIARYAKYLLEEFKDYELEEIMTWIESDNPDSPMVHGMNTEINLKGKIIADEIVKIKNPYTNEIIYLDIEMQATERKLEYPLPVRAEYYGDSLIVNQKKIEFTNDDYGKIKKVYTIWIVLDSYSENRNSIINRRIQPEIIYGENNLSRQDVGKHADIMIYMSDKSLDHPVTRMIYDIFIKQETYAQKQETLKKYGILGLTEREMSKMCNYSEFYLVVEQRALEKGITQGISQGIDIGRTEEREKYMNQKVDTIRLIMNEYHKSFEDTYSFLNYDESEREQYRKLICN